MPGSNLPTLTSPLIISHSIFPAPLTSPPARPRVPQDLAAAQLQTTAQTAQPSCAEPVILLPETGGGLGGFVFAVVFVGFCLFAAWAGREAKR